jgi:hypothetical protein
VLDGFTGFRLTRWEKVPRCAMPFLAAPDPPPRMQRRVWLLARHKVVASRPAASPTAGKIRVRGRPPYFSLGVRAAICTLWEMRSPYSPNRAVKKFVESRAYGAHVKDLQGFPDFGSRIANHKVAGYHRHANRPKLRGRQPLGIPRTSLIARPHIPRSVQPIRTLQT